MVCPHCNQVLLDDSNFCQFCGKTLVAEPKTVQQETKKKKPFRTIVIVALLLILLAGNCYLLYVCNDLQSRLNKQAFAYSDLNVTKQELEYKIKNLQRKNQEQWEENQAIKPIADFYSQHAVIVPDDGTRLFHSYGCSYLNMKNGWWIYNYEAAESHGYKPCPYCQK